MSSLRRMTILKYLLQSRLKFLNCIINSVNGMTVEQQIEAYIGSQSDQKKAELSELHKRILDIRPGARLWFLDGRNSDNKVVSNPNIGYGTYVISYADGSKKEFYQIGLSANSAGISVYIMGLDNKNYLPETFGQTIGKAKVTGYCIKFKTITGINLDVLSEAILHGFQTTDKHTN